jgi:hypothetical protein
MAGSPWAFFVAGLCGLFSAEALDLMWRLVTAYLQGRIKLTLNNSSGTPQDPDTTLPPPPAGEAGRRSYDKKD